MRAGEGFTHESRSSSSIDMHAPGHKTSSFNGAPLCCCTSIALAASVSVLLRPERARPSMACSPCIICGLIAETSLDVRTAAPFGGGSGIDVRREIGAPPLPARANAPTSVLSDSWCEVLMTPTSSSMSSATSHTASVSSSTLPSDPRSSRMVTESSGSL